MWYTRYMKEKLVIYWSRRDLRIEDNPALVEALKYAEKENIYFLPIFIIEPYMINGDSNFQFGLPSRDFLSEALPVFAAEFPFFFLAQGHVVNFFIQLKQKYDITVYVNEDVHPDFYKQLRKIENASIVIRVYKDQLTVNKETRTGTKNIYSVFTPFKKAVWQEFIETQVLEKPSFKEVTFLSTIEIHNVAPIQAKKEVLQSLFSKTESIKVGGHIINLSELSLPQKNYKLLYRSEKEACAHFEHYIKTELSLYKDKRDSLEIDTTSNMSVALTWGLVSARMLMRDIREYYNDSFENLYSTTSDKGALHFISELIWREFYKYLFYHYPNLFHTEFQEKFRNIKWISEVEALHRFKLWIQGKTGYKIVDAAMMQLAKSGVMHNRARMIVASILTKNLGVDWRWGQEYFRAMLLDLDEASNNGGWQWGASVGADPKPIRIFNPYLQAENYDKKGIYQKKWLSPEYFEEDPKPIIEHKLAREEALHRYGLSKEDGVRDY
jgi:deoxyribodipyrimidine photo-lyase